VRSIPPVALLVPALALAFASCGCSGCDGRAAASEPDAAPPPAPPTSTASSSARAPAAPASSAADKAPLQLLKLVFTSEVKNKEPVDKLDYAQPGQRVYVHLTLRNRGADVRPVTLSFKVNGDARSKVDLKVDPSWSFRTWGYNTLRAGDLTGELSVELRDDAGALVTSARLPIKNKPDPAKPLQPRPEPIND
jgi:hypothetical protein